MRSWTRLFAFSILLSIFITTCLYSADTYELVIDDPANSSERWPLLVALPFAKGKAMDTESVEMIDAQGVRIAAQMEVVARYNDGSIRWAQASFTGRPDEQYRVRSNVRSQKPAEATSIQLIQSADSLYLDTGRLRVALPVDELLPDSVQVVRGGEWIYVTQQAEASLVDNQGRRAKVSGKEALIETEIVREGPQRVVIRKQGWYVTPEGERLARAVVRLSFFADSSAVQLSHTLVFTEDTRKLWLRDYGIDFSLAGAGSRSVLFGAERGAVVGVEQVIRAGEAVSLVQQTFPHYMEKESHFQIQYQGEKHSEPLYAGIAAQDWMDVSSGGVGVTVVLPNLAEQFPKELTTSAEKIRIGLWPQSCGIEMEFTASALAENYWQRWADYARGGRKALVGKNSNAQGVAKTHDLWLIYRSDEERSSLPVVTTRASKGVLALADPKVLTATQAIGWPMWHKDPERYPRLEALIDDFWERTLIGNELFPATGFIGWGSTPLIQISHLDGKEVYGRYFRVTGLVDYGMRRHSWALYARSGDRKYYDYGHQFNRYASDWAMFNWDAGERIKGAFPRGNIHDPFPWADNSVLLSTGNSGHDIHNWLLEYYLTGDERAKEVVETVADAMRKHWDLEEVLNGETPFLILRILTSLYNFTGDEVFLEMAEGLLEGALDFDRDFPFVLSSPLYKVERNALALYDYYQATGSPVAKEAVIRAMDHQMQFNRLTSPISYQNALLFLYSVIWNWTGDEIYLRAVNQLLVNGLVMEPYTVDEEVALFWDDPEAYATYMERIGRGVSSKYYSDKDSLIPYLIARRGIQLNMFALQGIPVALWAVSQANEPLEPFPVLMKSETAEPATIVFEVTDPQETEFELYYRTIRSGEIRPRVYALLPDGTFGKEVEAKAEIKQRMKYHSGYHYRHFNARIAIESDQLQPGLYAMTTGGAEELIVIESNLKRVALYCPYGFWLPGSGWLWNASKGLSAGMPMYFNVPKGTEVLRIFVGRPMTIYRPDGSVALDVGAESVGEIEIPVKGHYGAWSVQGVMHGHVQLLNVPPVVALGSAERLPVTSAGFGLPRADGYPVDRTALFSQGIVGQGVQLASGRKLMFAPGDLQENHYDFFPTDEGTIEFWYRSNHQSGLLPYRTGVLHEQSFVNSAPVQVVHQFGAGPRADIVYGYMNLSLAGRTGEKGKGSERSGGIQARHFFMAGDWVHVAVTWKLTPGKRGTQGAFRVFINGEPFERTWSVPGPLSGREPFALNAAGDVIEIGPFDGTMDQLRISQGVRYTDTFYPQRDYSADPQTLAFFDFEENVEGRRADGKSVKARLLEPTKKR